MDTYPRRGEGRIVFYSIKLNGIVIGYIWATLNDRAMAYWKNVGALEVRDAANASKVWNARIKECYERGLEVLNALEYLKNYPCDPLVGGVDPAAVRNERSSINEFHKEITGRPLGGVREVPSGVLEDGTPIDRSRGWGPLSPMDPSTKTYKSDSNSPITYLPVEMEGEVIGYLWASNGEGAAGFVWKETSDGSGFAASGEWHEWLSRCRQQGLEPIEAVRTARELPNDSRRGRVAVDSEEKILESLVELRRLL